MTVLMLQPALHEKIWGGTKLKTFGYNLASDHVGEAWVVSAHANGVSTVTQGEFAGQSLAQLWSEQPALFGGHDPKQAFPLLVKILDAQQNLSIQVHPNDKQSSENFGKTESWYILEATPGAKLYYGHHASTKAALRTLVDNQDWDALLRTIPIQAGDFFYVPAGTFHALGAGVLALEIQQSSDTTYRFYDFDRLDPTTHQPRPLQIEAALAVTKTPHVDPILNQRSRLQDQTIVTRLLTSPKFTIDKLSVRGDSHFNQHHPYELYNVIAGELTLTAGQATYPLKKGDNFIMLKDTGNYTLSGRGEVIVSFVTPTSYREQELSYLDN
ncbi:type I phosphomannose isomerase catalytic subunit [Leuconostoc holzapfelii]|uniref:Mannose-6-phosphate isomerase n=1 Tax=Leuconostoc holzapfelii TaxID=434464 RepID=A0A846ZEJ3_9LACO|nr:type I phosphomannose isomerase catalytic subunit [Leuconostoc holzapfelii]NKZ17969.1 class I mannose-6-phosphate isomerase [Leuconostoc holzapfelii]